MCRQTSPSGKLFHTSQNNCYVTPLSPPGKLFHRSQNNSYVTPLVVLSRKQLPWWAPVKASIFTILSIFNSGSHFTFLISVDSYKTSRALVTVRTFITDPLFHPGPDITVIVEWVLKASSLPIPSFYHPCYRPVWCFGPWQSEVCYRPAWSFSPWQNEHFKAEPDGLITKG